MTGTSDTAGWGQNDYATVAYDAATGTEQWVARYHGPRNAGAVATSLGVSPNGLMLYVTGYDWGVETLSDYATVAYAAGSGRRLWVSRYAGQPRETEDNARALAVSPDGAQVVVSGYSFGGLSTHGDYATVGYQARTGQELGVVRYGPGNLDDEANAVGFSPDGARVYVTGWSSYGPDGPRIPCWDACPGDFATLAYQNPYR